MRKSIEYSRWGTIIIFLASSASVGSWLIWEKAAFLWGIFIVVAQILSIIMPFFHFSDHASLINLLLPELQELISYMETNWEQFTSNTPRDIIISVMEKSQKRLDELESHYVNIQDFPRRDSCARTAEKDRDDYVAIRHGIKEEEASI